MAEPKGVPVKWTGIEEFPVYFCNSFLIQGAGNESYLTLGYANPKVFLTPPTQEEVDAITFVEARPVVRIGLSRERLLELIGMLEIHLRNTDPQSEN